MASSFLGKYASITAVDLIQRKKLNFWNFYESNLTEARFVNSLPFYTLKSDYVVAAKNLLFWLREQLKCARYFCEFVKHPCIP